MTELQTISMNAFDRNGIHCGSAQFLPDGRWQVQVSGQTGTLYCETEQTAVKFLNDCGAVTIERERFNLA